MPKKEGPNQIYGEGNNNVVYKAMRLPVQEVGMTTGTLLVAHAVECVNAGPASNGRLRKPYSPRGIPNYLLSTALRYPPSLPPSLPPHSRC